MTSATVNSFDDVPLDDRGIYVDLSLSGTTASYFGSWAYTAP